MRSLCLLSLLCLGGFAIAAEEEIFHPPVSIQAGEKPIDVEYEGFSAPFVGDFDGDGVRDLLVGQYEQQRLRVYRNLGSDIKPRFKEYSWFKTGEKVFQSSTDDVISNSLGFTPQLVDLNGDGRTDILTGSYPLGVLVFLRKADGTFDPVQTLLNAPANAETLGQTSTAFAVDWDADGNLDLLLGHASGPIHLARGGKTALGFGPLEPLTADGKPIQTPGGAAAPVAADWDGDGRLDLIVGDGSGSVHWYRNTGTATKPMLAAAQQLLPPDPAGNADDDGRRPGQWGTYAKPCVLDWNGDGRLDLLVGDRCGWFKGKPTQTAEEQQEEQVANERLPTLRKSWAEAFALFQQELNAPASDSTRLAERRRPVVDLNHEIARAQAIRIRYQEHQQAHGFVWLFLRK